MEHSVIGMTRAVRRLLERVVRTSREKDYARPRVGGWRSAPLRVASTPGARARPDPATYAPLACDEPQ